MPILALLLQAAPSEAALTTGGKVFLGLAWTFVTGLTVWSFARVLRNRRPS